MTSPMWKKTFVLGTVHKAFDASSETSVEVLALVKTILGTGPAHVEIQLQHCDKANREGEYMWLWMY